MLHCLVGLITRLTDGGFYLNVVNEKRRMLSSANLLELRITKNIFLIKELNKAKAV